jgi:hypothetical protein
MTIKELYSTALEQLPSDLLKVSEGMRWCHNDGYWPENKTRTGSGRVEEDVDYVPGAKYDCGIGSYRSREAYRVGRRQLRKAEVNLAAGLLNLGMRVQKSLSSTTTKWQAVIESCKWRVDQYPSEAPGIVMNHAIAASGIIWKTLGCLQSAMTTTAPPSLPTVEMCEVCTIRLALYKKDGVRCDTCYRYWRRTGNERPRSKDKGITNIHQEALERAEQRKVAGAGFGAS